MPKLKLPAAALLLLALIGAAPLTASAPLSASAAKVTVSNSVKVQTMKVKMIFDGVSIQPPAGQYSFIYNNSTYVPLRFMSYALHKSVSWDAKNVKVTVVEPTSTELVMIKEYLMNLGSDAPSTAKSIILKKVNAGYIFNGVSKKLTSGQSSFILNGTLYVPLRFFAESISHSIGWDQKTKTITATSASYQGTNGIDSGSTSNGSGSGTSTSHGDESAVGTPSYEQITNSTEAKLRTLQSQSESTLFELAKNYLTAADEKTKTSLLAEGRKQLSSFTASFNSILADAEQQLTKYGYSTAIISEYRATFEAELQKGMAIAEGLAQ